MPTSRTPAPLRLGGAVTGSAVASQKLWFAALSLAGLAMTSPAAAQTQAPSTPIVGAPTVTIIGATPLPGVGIDADKLPNVVQTLSAAALTREGSASIVTALNGQLGSVSINDNLDDPFQPDILFRGFEASPVLGTPEGLAVYQNGVRVNEAFGDGLNWDLFPDVAVSRVTVVSSNPLYGLNALGGAVVIDMKNGFTYQGAEAELSGGSWGQRGLVAQYGASFGDFGLYLAGRALNEDGWRNFSPDSLRQLYSAFSYHTPRLALDLSFAGADNLLSGESPTPVQELEVKRSLVFTSPQNNRNRLTFVTLNGRYSVRDDLSLQGNVYVRDFRQSVVNGDTTDYRACAAAPDEGELCEPDGATPLAGADGRPLPDITSGGLFPLGEIDFEEIHSLGLGGSLQANDARAVFGHENHFSVGGSYDQARTNFRSSLEVGNVGADLQVAPSTLFVDTPEDTPWSATPVGLIADNRYGGLFATDTFNLSKALAVTASARYNAAEIDLYDQLGSALDGKSRYSRINPGLGFTDKLTDGLTAFAGYSEGNRTPTPSEIECSNPAKPCLLPSSLSSDPPNLRQVVSKTWEAGFRGRYSAQVASQGQITWSADVFRTDVDDDIYGVATSLSAGYFQNVGETRRQGAEISLRYEDQRLSLFFNYSHVDATFQSSFQLNSPENSGADAAGDIQVRRGDVLPGIPADRVKVGGEFHATRSWRVGADMIFESDQYFRGDESNQMKPLAGYGVLNLHSQYNLGTRAELFVNVVNAANGKYATFGVLGDPTGIGAPGVPVGATTNGPGVDNRFESPAPPLSVFAGVRVHF